MSIHKEIDSLKQLLYSFDLNNRLLAWSIISQNKKYYEKYFPVYCDAFEKFFTQTLWGGLYDYTFNNNRKHISTFECGVPFFYPKQTDNKWRYNYQFIPKKDLNDGSFLLVPAEILFPHVTVFRFKKGVKVNYFPEKKFLNFRFTDLYPSERTAIGILAKQSDERTIIISLKPDLTDFVLKDYNGASYTTIKNILKSLRSFVDIIIKTKNDNGGGNNLCVSIDGKFVIVDGATKSSLRFNDDMKKNLIQYIHDLSKICVDNKIYLTVTFGNGEIFNEKSVYLVMGDPTHSYTSTYDSPDIITATVKKLEKTFA